MRSEPLIELLPTFDMRDADSTLHQRNLIPSELIRLYRIIPLKNTEYYLLLGIADPTHQNAMSAVKFHTGLNIQFALINEIEIEEIINLHYQKNILYSQIETTLSKIVAIEDHSSKLSIVKNNDELPTKIPDEPVTNFVDSLIQEAIDKGISDIHIEPNDNNTRIRFRRDGLLYEAAVIPKQLSARISTRLKIMGNLNISERRIPQDGRIQLENKVDIRINTCPTLHDEKIVLRILDTKKLKLSITSLGLTHNQENAFINKINQPQGLILVTGPTGSGKTITLYSALHYLNQIEKNICTVEDPVEIELPGINQVNINPHIGLNFAAALHTLLRQDPDILMIGEIRDKETANIAIQAAQTGHLVLSTLHTNSATEAITRLKAFNISSEDLMQSLTLIIAQRLIRKLCEHCKQHENNNYQAIGCEYCNKGYAGRIGIFELLTDNLYLDNLKLWDIGLQITHSGITCHEEIERTLGTQP